MEYDVFISYSNQDREVAQRIWAYLQQKGLKPWIAPQCIPAGEPYARAIINGISKCRLMVVILSKTSNSSDDVLNEVDQAHREKKVILPFIIDETEMSGEMRYYLSRKQWINAFPEVTIVHCEKLFKAIGTYLPSNSGEKPQDGGIPNEPQPTPREMKLVEPKPEVKIGHEKEKIDVAQTMMEKFPEMDLVPTSLYDWRKPKKSRVLSVIFFIISLLPLTFFMLSLIDCTTITWENTITWVDTMTRKDTITWKGGSLEENYYIEIAECDSVEGYHYYLLALAYYDWHSGTLIRGSIIISDEDIPDYYRFGLTKQEVLLNVSKVIGDYRAKETRSDRWIAVQMMITFFIFALPFLFLGYLFFGRYPKKGSPTLSSLADYIQKYRYKRKTRFGKKPQFVFFVKDCLFGVMDVADYKVQIPAEYERIGWKVKDSIIRVTKGGHDFFIDINGERLQ